MINLDSGGERRRATAATHPLRHPVHPQHCGQQRHGEQDGGNSPGVVTCQLLLRHLRKVFSTFQIQTGNFMLISLLFISV